MKNGIPLLDKKVPAWMPVLKREELSEPEERFRSAGGKD